MVQTLFGSEKSTPGLLDRMRQAVASTKAQLVERLEEITEGNPEIDPSLLDELEATLLSADLGVKTTQAILAAIRERVSRRQLRQASELTAAVKQEILSMLKGSGQDAKEPGASERETSEEQRLDVIFVVGVNGVGKTTSIAKLARHWQAEGHQPLLAAADTFRAAATEQLEIWANRLG
ncbi:MAG: signal recognition particle receptor subunit alpha, partial [Acidobacteriota bacterium]